MFEDCVVRPKLQALEKLAIQANAPLDPSSVYQTTVGQGRYPLETDEYG